MTRVAPCLVVLALLGACSSDAPAPVARAPEVSPTPPTVAKPTAAPFDLDAPIPRHAPAFATELTQLTRDLNRAISRWVDSGTRRRGPEARAVELRAVRQQRMYRTLLDRQRFARRVLELLPRRLAGFAAGSVRAGSHLRRLVTPLDKPPDWTIHQPAPARVLLRYYRAAARRFDLSWQVLASINFVETRFGRLLGPSSAGARGPMQFMPATWDAYGGGGDIDDPRDSIMAAGRYLAASGAPERMDDALFAYNRSDAYVRAIAAYARHMTRDPRTFYAYYHWQVYVLTKDGDMQLSGPGAIS